MGEDYIHWCFSRFASFFVWVTLCKTVYIYFHKCFLRWFRATFYLRSFFSLLFFIFFSLKISNDFVYFLYRSAMITNFPNLRDSRLQFFPWDWNISAGFTYYLITVLIFPGGQYANQCPAWYALIDFSCQTADHVLGSKVRYILSERSRSNREICIFKWIKHFDSLKNKNKNTELLLKH